MRVRPATAHIREVVPRSPHLEAVAPGCLLAHGFLTTEHRLQHIFQKASGQREQQQADRGDESAVVTCPTNQPFAKSIRSPSDALVGLCLTQNRHGSSWELLGNQSSALSSLSFLRLPIFLFVNEQF